MAKAYSLTSVTIRLHEWEDFADMACTEEGPDEADDHAELGVAERFNLYPATPKVGQYSLLEVSACACGWLIQS